jgi:hypothetical protein
MPHAPVGAKKGNKKKKEKKKNVAKLVMRTSVIT